MKFICLTTRVVWVLLIAQNWLFANNLSITSIVQPNDSTLQFNISWENSWRTTTAPSNHDAVWIFIKKRECAASQWSHTDISGTTSDHVASSPLQVYLDGKNNKGFFLRRSATGSGNISNATVSVRLANAIPGQYDFKVLGIEMVYVPQGAFYVGDGGTANYQFYTDNSPTNPPYRVTSENAIPSGANSLAGYLVPTTGVPAHFPKGYASFYCMKYEISQGQYADFINMLAYDQALNRYNAVSASYRNMLAGSWPLVSSTTPSRAMIDLSWDDLAAYLDWSALRPMTELEFEKVCRGTATYVLGEYAWGTGIITPASTIINDGTATEAITSPITAGGGIANYGSSCGGVVRCGFAAKATTTRFQSGASYYGAMEMSGNAAERVISIDHPNFDGAVGDGELDVAPNAGFATVTSWIPTSSMGSYGIGYRGGDWYNMPVYLETSNRYFIIFYNSFYNSYYNTGGRGVR